MGTNRINWDIRYDNPPTFTHSYAQVMGAVPVETPWSPEGPLALPGVYTLKLTVDGKSYTQTVTLKNDPRSPATAADLAAQHELMMKLYDGSKEAWEGYSSRSPRCASARRRDLRGIESAGRSGDARSRHSSAKLAERRRQRRRRRPRGRGRSWRCGGRAAAGAEFRRGDGGDESADGGARFWRYGAERTDAQGMVIGCADLKTAVNNWKRT